MRNSVFNELRMNHVTFCIFIVLFSTNYNFGRCENAKLTVELMNSGFHRDLKYVVVFPEYQGKHHTFLIKQVLPASVYVSTDQLEDLRRFDKIDYFIDKVFIDIEKPTEKSEPFTIHLFGDSAFLQAISLPVHFRYHEPANKSFVTVNIPVPELYIELDEGVVEPNADKPVWMMCKDLRHRCKWAQVVFDNYSRKPLSANIPIGNSGLSGTVTIVTIALSWAASLFISFVIWKKNASLKIKLKSK